MLHYLHGSDLNRFPQLTNSMFRDRRRQFIDRMGWDLNATEEGYEVDQYDRPETLYIVCATDSGDHAGSMRFLPTSGNTMVEDHFGAVIPGIAIKSDRIWECTRFCTARSARSSVAPSLLVGAAKLMKEQQLQAFLGVFDSVMERAYLRLGSPPFILGSQKSKYSRLSVGLWAFDEKLYQRLIACSHYTADELELMYANSVLFASLERYNQQA